MGRYEPNFYVIYSLLFSQDSKGLSSSTVGPQMLPALAFDDVFEISIQDPVVSFEMLPGHNEYDSLFHRV